MPRGMTYCDVIGDSTPNPATCSEPYDYGVKQTELTGGISRTATVRIPTTSAKALYIYSSVSIPHRPGHLSQYKVGSKVSVAVKRKRVESGMEENYVNAGCCAKIGSS